MKNYFSRHSQSHGGEPTPVLSAKFGEAMCFAAGLHRRQARKQTTIPYASHLLAVASSVLEHGGTEDQAIAALLHDAIEDQSGHDPTPLKNEIEQLFGSNVLAIVLACSDSESSEEKVDWRTRKAAYIRHLATVSESALLVSLADKSHNARSIVRDLEKMGSELWRRFTGGKEGTLWYYRALVEAFRNKGNPVLVMELDRTVTRMEELAG